MDAAGQVSRILLVAPQDSQAELWLNQLRRAGLDLTARQVDQPDTLAEMLATGSWHMLIAFSGLEEIRLDDLLRNLQQTQQDLPCLLILNQQDAEQDTEKLLKLGAAAVFRDDLLQDPVRISLFPHRAERELRQLQERREKRRTHLALQEFEHSYRRLLDSSRDALACIQDGVHVYCNSAWARFFGAGSAEDFQQIPLRDLVDDRDLPRVTEFLQQLDRPADAQCGFLARSREGEQLAASLECADISWQGAPAWQLRVRPRSGNLQAGNRNAERAGRDLVTGLLDRDRLLETLNRHVAEAAHHARFSALLVIEIEDSDSLRRVIGKSDFNQFMADLSQRLQKFPVTPEALGRINDGGFALLLSKPDEASQEILQKELEQLQRDAIKLLPRNTSLTISHGMAVITDEVVDSEMLLSRAQHNRIMRLYQGAGSSEAGRDRLLLRKLHHALDNREISPVFQPVVSLREDGKERYEVRVRIPDGEKVLEAARFLDLVNQHGLGEQLDRLVLQRTLELLRHTDSDALHLIINLTQNSLSSNALLEWLARELYESRISADRLTLQISEIDMLSAPDAVEQFARQCHELGCELSITHFGCALEPFRQLGNIPVQYAKLDRSLLNDIDLDSEQWDRLNSIVSSLHTRGILVIAPMIEDVRFLPRLWQVGVNFVQGNLLRAPTDALDFSFLQEEEITLDPIPGNPD